MVPRFQKMGILCAPGMWHVKVSSLGVLILLGCSDNRLVSPYPEQFEGLGVELGQREDRFLIIDTLSQGPAEQAGLRIGDQILAINGTKVDNWRLVDLVERLRGHANSKIALTVLRNKRKLYFVIKRQAMIKKNGRYLPLELSTTSTQHQPSDR
jgi:predicted metalloprotease with PDZ domain